MKDLMLDGGNFGLIHAKKTEGKSTIWLTEKDDGAWYVIVRDPSGEFHLAGFLRDDPMIRAHATYDDFSMPHVLGAFLEGQDS